MRQLEADKVYVEDFYQMFDELPTKKVWFRRVSYDSVEEIQKQISQQKAKFESLVQGFDKRMELNEGHDVFVTLEEQHMVKALVERYEGAPYIKKIRMMLGRACPCLPFL